MSFVEDVTIGEGESVPPDTAFTKTWRIQNTGGCPVAPRGGSLIKPWEQRSDGHVPIRKPLLSMTPSLWVLSPEAHIQSVCAGTVCGEPVCGVSVCGDLSVLDLSVVDLSLTSIPLISVSLPLPGAESWPPGVCLKYIGGDQFGHVNMVLVRSLEPQETFDVSVQMHSPAAPGMYQGQWRMCNATGLFYGGGTYQRQTLNISVN